MKSGLFNELTLIGDFFLGGRAYTKEMYSIPDADVATKPLRLSSLFPALLVPIVGAHKLTLKELIVAPFPGDIPSDAAIAILYNHPQNGSDPGNLLAAIKKVQPKLLNRCALLAYLEALPAAIAPFFRLVLIANKFKGENARPNRKMTNHQLRRIIEQDVVVMLSGQGFCKGSREAEELKEGAGKIIHEKSVFLKKPVYVVEAFLYYSNHTNHRGSTVEVRWNYFIHDASASDDGPKTARKKLIARIQEDYDKALPSGTDQRTVHFEDGMLYHLDVSKGKLSENSELVVSTTAFMRDHYPTELQKLEERMEQYEEFSERLRLPKGKEIELAKKKESDPIFGLKWALVALGFALNYIPMRMVEKALDEKKEKRHQQMIKEANEKGIPHEPELNKGIQFNGIDMLFGWSSLFITWLLPLRVVLVALGAFLGWTLGGLISSLVGTACGILLGFLWVQLAIYTFKNYRSLNSARLQSFLPPSYREYLQEGESIKAEVNYWINKCQEEASVTSV